MNKMIPSEVIHTDESGNAVIGKNLEVNGTTKLNDGLKAIHTYIYAGLIVEVYFEKQNTDFQNSFSFIGCIEGMQFVIGSYQIENGNITHLNFLSIDNDGFQEYIDDNYYKIATENVTALTNKATE